MTTIEELRALEEELEDAVIAGNGLQLFFSEIERRIDDVSRSWSGSFIGYHAYVYFGAFEPVPPGCQFNSEWGLTTSRQGKCQGWREVDPAGVTAKIFGNRSTEMDEWRAQTAAATAVVERARDTVRSILHVVNEGRTDLYLLRFDKEIREMEIHPEGFFLESWAPKQVVSRDSKAVNQGIWVPPHLAVLATAKHLREPFDLARLMANKVSLIAKHVERCERKAKVADRGGSRVFIGHGGSDQWRVLKDYITERLGLKHDEFNRAAVAGKTTIERLGEMLDDAAVAFVVLTAEDERADGTVAARMNVIHETGLFQGRLGFARAIVLLEDGCEEFSNIRGLTQIRFPKGTIKAAFDEVRQVLVREGLLSS